MADQESSADRPRLVQGWRLFGANWMAARTVFVCRLAGAYRPEFWSVVRDLIARILPARAGDPLLDDTPATLAEATETLARFLLAWCGHPVAAIERTELGRGARMHAAVAMGSPEMTSAACVFAIRVLTRAAGMPHADAGWIAQSTENLIQARRDGAQWLRSSRAFIARAAEARDIPWRVFTPAQHVLVLGEGRLPGASTHRPPRTDPRHLGRRQQAQRQPDPAARGPPALFQIRVDSRRGVKRPCRDWACPWC
jgi:hypothetical protein